VSQKIKPGDKVFVSNRDSDYFGKGTFEVLEINPDSGVVTINTKDGPRRYKSTSITPIKPLPADYQPTVKPKGQPIPQKSAPDEKNEMMDFFKRRNHQDVSNTCPKCGKRATALSFSIVCSTAGCPNFRP
jgi:hypothetical protein